MYSKKGVNYQNSENEEERGTSRSSFYKNSLKINENLCKFLTPKMKKKNKDECKNQQPVIEAQNSSGMEATEIHKDFFQKPKLACFTIRDHTRKASPEPYKPFYNGNSRLLQNRSVTSSSRYTVQPESNNDNIKDQSKSEHLKPANCSPNKSNEKKIELNRKIDPKNCLRHENSILKKNIADDELHKNYSVLKSTFFQRRKIHFANNIQNSGDGDGEVRRFRGVRKAENRKDTNENHLKIAQKNEMELRKAFNVFDCDGFGCISIKQLRHIMTTLGETLSEKEIEDMIQLVDVDGDGVVKCDELVKVLS